MKLIGVITGSYEGNNFAKLIFTERLYKNGCFGDNAIISKANFSYVITNILPYKEQYIGMEVLANYDRFGRVSEILLDTHSNMSDS